MDEFESDGLSRTEQSDERSEESEWRKMTR